MKRVEFAPPRCVTVLVRDECVGGTGAGGVRVSDVLGCLGESSLENGYLLE